MKQEELGEKVKGEEGRWERKGAGISEWEG